MKKSISTALISFLGAQYNTEYFQGLSRSTELMVLLNTPENILEMAHQIPGHLLARITLLIHV